MSGVYFSIIMWSKLVWIAVMHLNFINTRNVYPDMPDMSRTCLPVRVTRKPRLCRTDTDTHL